MGGRMMCLGDVFVSVAKYRIHRAQKKTSVMCSGVCVQGWCVLAKKRKQTMILRRPAGQTAGN
jgi:hypothetical protein